MNVGVGLPTAIPGTDGRLVVDWARQADAGPFSSLGVLDRLVYDSYEPLAALAAAAAVTHRLHLATMIVIAPLRNTVLLAKMAATVDALSGGRLVLGLAVGARREDYEAAGVDHRGRGQRFSEQLAALRAIWEEETRPHPRPLSRCGGRGGTEEAPSPPAPLPPSGRGMTSEASQGEGPPGAAPSPPAPLPPSGRGTTSEASQGEGPPAPTLLVGGLSDEAFARVARYADGYVHGGGPPRAFARAADKARSAWVDAGRPGRPRLWAQGYFALGDTADAGARYLKDYYAFTGPFAEKIAAGLLTTPQAIAQFVRGYADAGCDELVLFPTVAAPDQFDRLAEVVEGLR